MKLLLRSKESNVLTLVDTLDEPRYKEFYNDTEGGPLDGETIGTTTEEEVDFTVSKTVVEPVKEKKTRKSKKVLK